MDVAAMTVRDVVVVIFSKTWPLSWTFGLVHPLEAPVSPASLLLRLFSSVFCFLSGDSGAGGQAYQSWYKHKVRGAIGAFRSVAIYLASRNHFICINYVGKQEYGGMLEQLPFLLEFVNGTDFLMACGVFETLLLVALTV